MFLVQIGPGSASLDTNFEDGFSNFVKRKKIKKKIFIVEANSIHLKNLKKFYSKEKTVILNYAIIPDNINKKKNGIFLLRKGQTKLSNIFKFKIFCQKTLSIWEYKKKNC